MQWTLIISAARLLLDYGFNYKSLIGILCYLHYFFVFFSPFLYSKWKGFSGKQNKRKKFEFSFSKYFHLSYLGLNSNWANDLEISRSYLCNCRRTRLRIPAFRVSMLVVLFYWQTQPTLEQELIRNTVKRSNDFPVILTKNEMKRE